jgi:transposase
MAYLTDDRMKVVSKKVCDKLVELGHQPDTVIFDTTNFSTEMDPDDGDEDRTLPQPGYAKDGKFQNNIIGTAIATTKENLPFPVETYPGNWNDHMVVDKVIDDLLDRIERLRRNKAKKNGSGFRIRDATLN